MSMKRNRTFSIYNFCVMLLCVICVLSVLVLPVFAEPAEDMPAKHEAWQVRNGSVYTFAEGGEKTPQALALIPKSQLEAGAVNCYNYKFLRVGDQDRLSRLCAPHFMIAGSEGAVVTEYACYHSMDGLKFSNPKAHA